MQGKGIIWLDERDAENVSLVGGKFANMALLGKAGINVPWAFSVSAKEYRNFVDSLQNRLKVAVSEIDFSTFASIERASEQIRGIITGTEVPGTVHDEVVAAYRELAERFGSGKSDLPVAVRSSSTVEDSADTSLAGQHETYLWVRGEEEVMKRVVDCWASVFTARSLRYRDSKGLDQLAGDMAVAVQMMVHSTVSGVMFTINPKNGDRSKVTIESSWGLGEAIVGGLVTPDLFIVDKVTLEILEKKISKKEREFVVTDGRVLEREVEAQRKGTPTLSDDQVVHIAKLGKAIEKHFGFSQDIEWAIDSSVQFPQNTFVLQARPETVWSQRRKEALGVSGDAVDIVVDKLIRGERVGG